MSVRLFFLILGVVTDPAVAGSSKADLYWQRGDYRRAFAEASEPAARGDGHAQFLLGEAYRLGRSVDANYPLAIEYYGKAARGGDVGAATELGLLLIDQKLPAIALPWLTLAARAGRPRALWGLGLLYLDAAGGAPDPALGFGLISRAAAAGVPEAQAKLAALRPLLPPEMQARGEALARAELSAPTPVRAPDPKSAEIAVRPPLIQLGAYSSGAAAERAWAKLAETIDGTVSVDHRIVRVGMVYRLQVRPPDPHAADLLRRQLKAAGWRYFTRSAAS